MNEFEAAVSAAESKYLDASQADGRLKQDAAAMDPCVDRLIRGEFEPSGHWALSRTKLPGPRIPNLSQLLAGRLEEASQADRESLYDAVCQSVATGYVLSSTVMQEKEIAGDRSPEKIWDAWAAHFMAAPIGARASEEVQDQLAELSLFPIFSELQNLGLITESVDFLEGLGLLGRLYAYAGFALRLLQLKSMPDSAWSEIVAPPGSEHLQFDSY